MTIDEVTEELILQVCKQHRLRLLPGGYFQRLRHGRWACCCPLGALALYLFPETAGSRIAEAVLARSGLPESFLLGVARGFDFLARDHNAISGNQEAYQRGYTFGQRMRLHIEDLRAEPPAE